MNHYFGKMNYIIMGIGCTILPIGFLMMSGNEDIYGTSKTVVAPILLILGFVVNGFAIMYRKKDPK